MINCTHYPELVMSNFADIELRAAATLSDEEMEHLQQVAALKREARMERSGYGDLCQSDLD